MFCHLRIPFRKKPSRTYDGRTSSIVLSQHVVAQQKQDFQKMSEYDVSFVDIDRSDERSNVRMRRDKLAFIHIQNIIKHFQDPESYCRTETTRHLKRQSCASARHYCSVHQNVESRRCWLRLWRSLLPMSSPKLFDFTMTLPFWHLLNHPIRWICIRRKAYGGRLLSWPRTGEGPTMKQEVPTLKQEVIQSQYFSHSSLCATWPFCH